MPKSNSEFWGRKFELNRERDERKRQALEDAGWTVITVWECEIRERPGETAHSVADALASSKTR